MPEPPSSPSASSTTNRTLAILIGPASSPDAVLSITSRLASSGFEVLSERRERWHLPHDADFLAEFLRAEGEALPRGMEDKKRWMLRLSNADIYVMVLERRKAVELWNDILGPDEDKEGLGSVPGSLRATYGVGNLYGSLSREAADRQLAIAFPEWASDEALDRLNEEELLGDTSGVALEAATAAQERRHLNSSNEGVALSSRHCHSRGASQATDLTQGTPASSSSSLPPPEALDNAPQIDDEDVDEQEKVWSAAAAHKARLAEARADEGGSGEVGDVSHDGTTILHAVGTLEAADNSFGYEGSEPSFSLDASLGAGAGEGTTRTPRASQGAFPPAAGQGLFTSPSSPSLAPSDSISVAAKSPPSSVKSPSKAPSSSARQVVQPASIRPPSVAPRLSRAAALRMGVELPDASPRRRPGAESAASNDGSGGGSSVSGTTGAGASSSNLGISGLPKSAVAQPKSLAKPSIVPRLNRAAAARTGAPLPPPQANRRNSVVLGGGEGEKAGAASKTLHKRASSLGISGLAKQTFEPPKSLAKPSIAPRLNRAAVARLGGGAEVGEGGASSSPRKKTAPLREQGLASSNGPSSAAAGAAAAAAAGTTNGSGASPHKRSSSSLGLVTLSPSLTRRPSANIASLAQPAIVPRSNAAERARRMSVGGGAEGVVSQGKTSRPSSRGAGGGAGAGAGAGSRPGSALAGGRPASRSGVTGTTQARREAGVARAPPSSYRAVA